MSDDIKTQFIGAVRTGLSVGDQLADLRRQLDAEKAKVKRLREACKGAVETIKDWHGPAAWDIYLNHAPEMRLITAALAETEKTT